MSLRDYRPIRFLVRASVISACLLPVLALAYLNNQDAEVVVGQPSMTANSPNQGGSTNARTLENPSDIFQAGSQQFIADSLNSRVLIYNSISISNNAAADVVVGQADMTGHKQNQDSTVAANTLNYCAGVFTDGTELFVADTYNHRVLIYDSIPVANNASANMAVGQPNLTSNTENQGLGPKGKTLNHPVGVFVSGGKLFVADTGNHRVLIFNTIPSAFDTYADVIVGQADQHDGSPNQGGAPAANTMNRPVNAIVSGTKLIVSDRDNHRVLIFNTIPTAIDASADIVIGQPNLTSNQPNQGGSPAANTLNHPHGLYFDGTRLFISDSDNHRVLLYQGIPASNNASADIVIGQPDFVSNQPNQGGSAGAGTLSAPMGLYASAAQVAVSDYGNHRALLHPDRTPTPTSTPTPVVAPTLTPFTPPGLPPRLGDGGGFAAPNPFLPGSGQKTTFNFTLQNIGSNYTIRILRMNGRLIRTLQNTREWDGRNGVGQLVEGGVYLYQIEAEGRKASGTVVLLEN